MIYEKIKSAIIKAMKDKDKDLVETLRSMDAEIQNKAIALKTKEITDELVIGVLQKGVKQRLESHNAFAVGGRNDLAVKERIQSDTWKFFLPEMMSEEEVREITVDIIKTLKQGLDNVTNIGAVIKLVKIETKSRADGAIISKVVKELLSR